jgi:hypothetical protein
MSAAAKRRWAKVKAFPLALAIPLDEFRRSWKQGMLFRAPP